MGYLKVVAVLLGTGAGTCGFGVRSKGSVEKRIGLPVRLRASRIGEDRALGSFKFGSARVQVRHSTVSSIYLISRQVTRAYSAQLSYLR